MRCTACNIDLGESVKVCPLCGAQATDEPASLPELHEAPYPSYDNIIREKRKGKKPNPHWLRVGLIVSALCVLLGESNLWTVVAPFCLTAVAVIYLIYGLKEKGTLMHAAVALVTSFLFQVLFFLHAAIHRMTLSYILFTLVITIVALLILYFTYPERVEAQMEATFHI